MGSRRKGRVIAFQALFSWEAHKIELDELLKFLWLDKERQVRIDDDVLAFARFIVAGAIENIDAIDAAIKLQAENWDFSRIAKVDLAILRMSVYGLLHQPDIHHTITINEAVEMAKKYGSGDSFRFVNGVLDGISKRGNPS